MKIDRIEYHQVHSYMTYDIPDEDIIEIFGSVDRFKEIVSHNSIGFRSDPYGEEPTDEEQDAFNDLFFSGDYDYEREDDWWSDRKGGYEVDYQIGDE